MWNDATAPNKSKWRGKRASYAPGIYTVIDVSNTPDGGLQLHFARWEHSNFKPTGKQGSWFAKIGPERLPVLKARCRVGLKAYHEPFYYDPADQRRAEYIEAIKRGRVLVANYNDEVASSL
jgi:hypothetical protein